MIHPYGPNGPYFRHPCQGDRSPSLTGDMGVNGEISLGSSKIAEMGFSFKSCRLNTCEAQKRAVQAALDANVPPARFYIRSTSRGLRRAVDIFMPRFYPDENCVPLEGQQR
uniref:Uncharacterized protein LOC108037213 n=1 Tax=Drosophila rhopaloa TaxID=1041015 RepID=A0A6P4DYR4_DRORH